MSDKDVGSYVLGATLLTLEQATGLPQEILRSDNRWWLKTPGYTKSTVTEVDEHGVIDGFGNNVESCYVGIRPVLLINADTDFFKSLRFGKEAKLYLEEEGYKHFFCIGKNSDGQGMLLPKNCIDKGQYRMDWKANNANSYEPSDAKKKADLFGEKMKRCIIKEDRAGATAKVSAEGNGASDYPEEWEKPQHPNRKKYFRKRKK